MCFGLLLDSKSWLKWLDENKSFFQQNFYRGLYANDDNDKSNRYYFLSVSYQPGTTLSTLHVLFNSTENPVGQVLVLF